MNTSVSKAPVRVLTNGFANTSVLMKLPLKKRVLQFIQERAR